MKNLKQTLVLELSLDLIEEILLRVPALSLAPWRYVCKQWKALITDPRFAKKHLRHEQQFTVFNNITVSEVNTSGKISSSTVSLLGIDYNELNNVPSLNMKVIKSWESSVYHMSHCDGLLLLMVMDYKLLVLNPLLKEARWIKSYATSHDDMEVFGLGYKSSSSCTNDYKIVMFRYSCIRIESRVYIYDFNSDRWKIVVDPIYDGFSMLPSSSVCLRGTPYWLGWNHEHEIMIRSFDFSQERFKPLVTPPKETDCDLYVGVLGVYEDHLSVLRRFRGTEKIHIWVRKNNIWNMLMKVYDIPQICMGRISYSIEKDDKLVICFRDTWNGSVTIYIVGENQKHQKLEHSFGVDRISGDCYYVPSLLQVPRPLKRRRKRKRINKLLS